MIQRAQVSTCALELIAQNKEKGELICFAKKKKPTIWKTSRAPLYDKCSQSGSEKVLCLSQI